MEIHVRDDSKIVEIWLRNAEKDVPETAAALAPLCQKYKEMKYLVAVFRSGKLDLAEETSALLVYNQKKSAERELTMEQSM